MALTALSCGRGETLRRVRQIAAPGLAPSKLPTRERRPKKKKKKTKKEKKEEEEEEEQDEEDVLLKRRRRRRRRCTKMVHALHTDGTKI